MRTLDEQADFLAGLTGPYLKAFILSIEVRSPTDFCIRWFDNTLTEIKEKGDEHDRYKR